MKTNASNAFRSRRLIRSLAVGAVALAMSACGISEEVYQRDINDLQGKLDQRQSELQKCQDELDAALAGGSSARSSLAQARKRIERLRSVAAKQQAVFDKLKKELAELTKAGVLSVEMVRGQLTLSISDKLLFDTGKSKIRSEAMEALERVTEVLRAISERRFLVAGHTDTDGSDSYNWGLSADRSRAVLDSMIEMGMAQDRIAMAAYGEHYPVASNDTDNGKQLNRRVEIIVVPDLAAIMGVLNVDTAGR